jgi:hypothetical protein
LASFWTATGEVLDQFERLERALGKSPSAGLALCSVSAAKLSWDFRISDQNRA